jgi:hypothetical protein
MSVTIEPEDGKYSADITVISVRMTASASGEKGISKLLLCLYFHVNYVHVKRNNFRMFLKGYNTSQWINTGKEQPEMELTCSG